MYFTDIYILESLGGGFSRRTGRRLHEELEGIVRTSTRTASVHYEFVTTKQDLLDRLAAIAADASERGGSPLLHLETHGSPNGLTLASEEFVAWQQLQPMLTDVNVAGHLNLVVMVSACHGLDLLKILRPTHRAPARLIIGPNRVLNDGEVEAANQAFYRTLFETFDGVIAHKAMNAAVASQSETQNDLFFGMSAERMFWLVMQRYFEEHCSEGSIDVRVDEHIASCIKGGAYPKLSDPVFLTAFRAEFRAELTNHPKQFEHYRRLFFFCDLQPENCSRFSITFEQCWTGASSSSARRPSA